MNVKSIIIVAINLLMSECVYLTSSLKKHVFYN